METARKQIEPAATAADPDSDEREVVYVARMLTPDDLRRREEEGFVLPEPAQRWREECADEIRAYNEEIIRRGIILEDLRTW